MILYKNKVKIINSVHKLLSIHFKIKFIMGNVVNQKIILLINNNVN